MDQSSLSCSCVKVEFYDPYKIFSCVAREFEARLPLRNLNWKSSYRPLRLIDTIYVSFETSDSSTISATDKIGSRETRTEAYSRDTHIPQRERRHQIPGFRQTPYLKILFVKCDDSESYKNILRKEIREWIKRDTITPAKGSKLSSQEHHDAFEWLIIHVVLPNKGGQIIWPDRNSAKVLQYLKDDFNGSSRNATDRIAQIPSTQALEEDTRAQIISASFKQESDEYWEDVLKKLKQLILTSFDQRVRQYEEDIKEKGAQKSLPGWNFNTFFVLKEGLARGFESVGLIEDALSGYDELQIELGSTVRNKRDAPDTTQDATIFKDYSPNIEAVCEAADGASMTAIATKAFENRLLDAKNDGYRDLILSSDVSVFDFSVYIFVRQIKLLRRLGEPASVASSTKQKLDFRFLCEIYERTAAFINSSSGALHQEVLLCLQRSADSRNGGRGQLEIASDTVSVWTYLVACTVLGLGGDKEILETSKPISIAPRELSHDRDSMEETVLHAQAASVPQSHLRSLLANRRAGLVKTARHALEWLAQRREWACGWTAAIDELKSSGLDVSVERSEVYSSIKADRHETGFWTERLTESMESEARFRNRYESLTHKALQYHREADDIRSILALQVDIATCKFLRQEYKEAHAELESIQREYLNFSWPAPHLQMTSMLAHCCKNLEDHEGYVRACLSLITQSQKYNSPILSQFTALSSDSKDPMAHIIEISRTLSENIIVPLDDFAQDIVIGSHIDILNNSDGLILDLRLRTAVASGFQLDRISLLLLSQDTDTEQPYELSAENVTVRASELQVIQLITHTFATGRYRPWKLEMAAGSIVLEKYFFKEDLYHGIQQKILNPASKMESILIWTPMTTVDTEIDVFESVDLDQPKSLVITIDHSCRHVTSLSIRLKAGTSGLRLRTSQASIISGSCELDNRSDPGLLELHGVEPGAHLRILVPYQTDTDVKDVIVRSQTSYLYGGEITRIEKSHRISNSLPLGVNVQDIFKPDSLFSKFSISTSNRIPIQILDSCLQSMSKNSIVAPRKGNVQYSVLSKQPVSLIYKIAAADESPEHEESRPSDLKLNIVYQCLDEVVFASVKAMLMSAVTKESLSMYARLLWSHMHNLLRYTLPRRDMDTIALVEETFLPSFESLGWSSLLDRLPQSQSEQLLKFLKGWHQLNDRIDLSKGWFDARRRSISIPVAIPPLPLLYSAEMQVPNDNALVDWHIGDAIPVEISLKVTRTWASSVERLLTHIETTFELDASSDTWIIGGHRKGTLLIEIDKAINFVVLLLPQRTGHLPLPSLEVRATSIDDRTDIHSELENRSQGKSISVLPGLIKPVSGSSIRPEKKSIKFDNS